MRIALQIPIVLMLALTSCEEAPLIAVGQLESDRVEVIAESNEPILEINVTEGDSVAPGEALLVQDTARLDIRIVEAEANIRRIEAMLDEQVAGPRRETIDATRASLLQAKVEHDFRGRDLARLSGLRERNLTSVESVDTAQMLQESAAARYQVVTAQLAELEAGTRVEQVEQTRGLLHQAQAQLASLQLDRERLRVLAPVLALVDSLPFEVGERPRPGDVVAVLLTGSQPFARVYIPEPLRVGIAVGSSLQLQVDGLEGTLTGRVRRIAAEASFTPYFALTERDRSRLSYLAEVELPPLDSRLPDGVPIQIVFE